MKVKIDPLAERRLFAFIRAKDIEVGGMGYATLQDDGSLHWSETFLVPQEVSSSEVDFEATNGDQAAVERALADGVLDDPRFVWVSWHSHHTMKAYWSKTDDERIAAMSRVGVKRLLSFVGSHDGSYELRLDMFAVSAHDIDIGQVTINGLSLTSESVADPFADQIKAELAENVKHKRDGFGSGYTIINSGFMRPDDLDRDERRIVRELRDEGYTEHDAQSVLQELGPEGCEDLLNDKYIGDRSTRYA